MSGSGEERNKIIEDIIDIEEKMFVGVQAEEPAACQSMLKTFRAMRRMSFSVLEPDTLASYLEDLREAVNAGRNLVMEKYARMDNLIPLLKDSETIYQIVNIEKEWMKELNECYPLSIKFDDKFTNYETSELETYSDHTLSLYYRDLFTAYKGGANLCEKRYLNLYKELGFNSLEEVEARAKLQRRA